MAIVFPEGTQNLPSGVIQCQSVSTGAFSTFSGQNSWQNIISHNITPKSGSSKILIIANIMFGWTSYYNAIGMRLTRSNGGGVIGNGTVSGAQSSGFMGMDDQNGGSANANQYSALFLDSPATTENRTYYVQGTNSRDSETWSVNGPRGNSNDAQCWKGISTLTLIEVE